jgi:hypothetical protein
MQMSTRARIAAALIVVGGAFGAVAPAHADVDTDFAAELHTYGIYGPRDFNAWLAKIACKRLETGVDHNAFDSARFLSRNLARGTTTEQSWQFLAAALTTYCDEQLPVLSAAAGTAH